MQCDSKSQKLGINFESMARDTLQQNHLAELGSVTSANNGRAMLIKANVPMEWQPVLWTEAFEMSTLSDGLTVTTINDLLKWCDWIALQTADSLETSLLADLC